MASSSSSLAVIGCGAIFEKWHLKALKKIGWKPSLLIDRNESRLRLFQKALGGVATATDHKAAIGKVGAAIVAVPHGFHAAICTELLEAGIDVLIEKPLALTEAECVRITEAARRNNRIVAVGHMRRFMSGHRWMKAFLDAGGLGELKVVDFREGGPFGWPVASPAVWDRAAYGGGVLFDTGAHTLDLLTWWLGVPEIVSYRDDSLGGVEADCLGTARLKDGGLITFELSRTHALRGTGILIGTKGRIEIDLVKGAMQAEPQSLLQQSFNGIVGAKLPAEGFLTMYVEQLKDFRAAVTERREPLCNGEAATSTVAFMEACYKQREPIDFSWMRCEARA